MLDTNVKLSEGVKAHVDFKIETKVDDVREEIEYNTIRIIFVQSKTLKRYV